MRLNKQLPRKIPMTIIQEESVSILVNKLCNLTNYLLVQG